MKINSNLISRIGTFNLQGANKKHISLADDMQKYKMAAMCTTETRMSGQTAHTIKTSDNKNEYYHYVSGNSKKTRYGVGIVVSRKASAEFLPINERLCKLHLKTETNDVDVVIICAYSPTEEMSKKHPDDTEKFYDDLESLIKSVGKRHFLVIGGDFNAKTGTLHKQYPHIIGRYGKGRASSNGHELAELCSRNNLMLANTIFRHKSAHITTWQAPENLTATFQRDGTIRRNPVRNQIDYIIIRQEDRCQIFNARSYSGMFTKSDHRLVIGDFKIRKSRSNYNRTNVKQIDYNKLKLEDHSKLYRETLCQKLNSNIIPSNIQNKWNYITNSIKETSKEILGYKDKSNKKSENPVVKKLSEHQRQIQTQINSSKNDLKCTELRKERNKVMNKIHRVLEEERNSHLISEAERIEHLKSDTHKMFTAVRVIQNKNPKRPLLINSDNGITTDPKIQVQVISDFYKNFYNNAKSEGILNVSPCEMKTPFSSDEIEIAIQKLKNNKSVGIDDIKAEELKHSPPEVSAHIADIFNEMAKTGEYPIEIKRGILSPLQKPNKKSGPCDHLRAIILFSVIRKILAMCLINRTGKKIEQCIPYSQAAYQKGRSTTEHVFAYKILAEKAICSKDYTVHILLMDLSKAFDTINRNKLIEDLRKVLDNDELHMIKILLDGVEYTVRCGDILGKPFSTNVGSPQGDCISALLFVFYLAMSLGFNLHLKDHSYSLPSYLSEKPPHEIQEHNYAVSPMQLYKLCKQNLDIDTQYSDDCGHAIISRNKHLVEFLKLVLPYTLIKRDLLCNADKNEHYEINKTSENNSWKKCKILGSLLDTTEDIKRRKVLTTVAMKSLHYIWTSRLTTGRKIIIFNAIVRSIFLYNSQIWTVTNSIRNRINSFQRRLLRNVLNVKYPKIISNADLIAKTKQLPWTSIIEVQRIRWLGHALRLPEETPAKQALFEAEREVPRPQGRPPTTWLGIVKKQLKTVGILWSDAKQLAYDRVKWRDILKSL